MYIPSYSIKNDLPSLMDVCFKSKRKITPIISRFTHLVPKCVYCREVAALGRSLAAVGGRLEALLVAAASQGLDQEALTSSTILTGPALTITAHRMLPSAANTCLLPTVSPSAAEASLWLGNHLFHVDLCRGSYGHFYCMQ